jgi:serine/threonine protein kinase
LAASADPAFDLLVDELIGRVQAGLAPDWPALAREHPQYVARLRSIAGAVEALGDLSRSGDSVLSGVAPWPAAENLVPGVLGDFRILQEVGRGGMGVVYEAEQVSLNRRVALKVLPLAATLDPRRLERFRHETRAAALLHHPHIVPVHGVGCERGVHYYAMQLIEGCSLAVVIDRLRGLDSAAGELRVPGADATGPYTPAGDAAPTRSLAALNTVPVRRCRAHFRRVAELMVQAAGALEYAHAMGVVHRDLKPANLLLDAGGSVWVTDFGLARLGQGPGLTASGDLLGTLRYMSPEQALARHGLVDHHTDVYSLGATLYELLTLRPAVDGASKQEVLDGQPPPPRPRGFGGMGSIATGPDGNLYFLHDGMLARITPTGALTDNVADEAGGSITAGPDGNLWVTGTRFDTQTGAVLGNYIDRITLSGSVTTFAVGNTNGSLAAIAAGPDGNLWFAEPAANQVGRITPAGQLTLFPVPTPGSQPTGIAAGSNGNVWFTEAAGPKLGEVFLTGTPPAAAAATTMALALDVAAPSVGQAVHLTATVTSGAAAPGGSVTFLDGATVLGTANFDAGGRAVLATVFRAAGSHSLTAVFNGTAAFAPSRSAAVPLTVSPAATTTTVTASANPVRVGQKLMLAVTVTPALAAAGAPAGLVELRDGNNIIAMAHPDSSGRVTLTLIPGRRSRTTNGFLTVLGRGTHHLTVSYLGDGDLAASVSAPLDLTVL